MAEHFETPDLRSAHVIVLGNEKGGTGKSTLSIHITIALLKTGYRVASIDLDVRQRTLTRFLENRRSWAQTAPSPVELPLHHALDRGASDNVRDNETMEFTAFAEAIAAVEHSYEFVVIDTPASDSCLMRLAHSLADTLVSPVNESFIYVDVFSRVHHNRTHRGLVAHYADLVLEARRKRRTRRQRHHRLGAGAQPQSFHSIEQCAPGSDELAAFGSGIAVSRRRRTARSGHLPRAFSDRLDRARSDRNGGAEPGADLVAARRP
jgi:hypothetical protein